MHRERFLQIRTAENKETEEVYEKSLDGLAHNQTLTPQPPTQ